jgi:hypothetical protein
MMQKATLKPYLDEIRQWVEQGRTDVWIAHTLNSTPASISAFRSSHGILRRDVASEARSAPPVIPPDAPPEESPTKRRRRAKKPTGAPPLSAPSAEKQVVAVAVAAGGGSDDEGPARKRRRRGGRGRKRSAAGYEAVLDHGDEGYGFWFDGAVRDDPVFAEHWAGIRALTVRIEADQIVIRPDDRG